MQTLFCLAAGFGMAAIAATGQPARSPLSFLNPGPEPVVVHGEISSSDSSLTSLIVELRSAGRGLPERVDVNPDGSFDIRSLTPGVYELVVARSGGTTIYQEHVNLTNAHENLFVRLPSIPKANGNAEGMVSIEQLQHNVPKSAQNALKKARDAVRNGRTQEALNEFHRAVSIDPRFVDAYDELGAWYTSVSELPKAVEQFRRALDLDPNDGRVLSNLCLILGKLGEVEEAGRLARRALQVDPGNANVHYVLAVSLINTSGESAEALDHLRRAVSAVPMAHLLAAQLLFNTGRREEARRQLNEYLGNASGEEFRQPPVQALLRQLQE